MNLSKLVLNPQSRQVQAELSNPYEMHRTLYGAFPSELVGKERILYRMETRNVPPYLVVLLQSKSRPDWSALEKKGYLQTPAQVKTIEPQFQGEQMLNFCLVANPTKRLGSSAEKMPGKRVALFKVEDQKEWLQRKSEQHGFSVIFLQTTDLSNQFAYKECDGRRVRITNHGVRFDGVLQVTDPRLFGLALSNGIGSAKGFGFGLLSLART